jgi:hypothetical protein
MILATTEESKSAWRGIVARAWSDAEFKARLLDDPNTVLTENGLSVPAGVHVVIVENEPARVHLVLPAKPGDELSVAELNEGDYDPGF